jgi:phage terminase small subunit
MSKAPVADRQAPGHLAPSTRDWWESVLRDYVLEPHHVRVLTLAGEAFDRATQAREAIAVHGMVYLDRFGTPHPRPEVAIERDSRLAFARLLRELALDVEAPSDPRVPRISPGYRKEG